MSRYVVAYIAALLVFLAGDFLWIGILMADFYKLHLGALMLAQPRLDAAALFYLMYIGGLLFFGVRPGLEAGSWKVAAFNSGLIGLIAYATYDLSNLATLKGWPVEVVVVDVIWGIFISAVGGLTGYAAARAMTRH